jgi:hypothetical protein
MSKSRKRTPPARSARGGSRVQREGSGSREGERSAGGRGALDAASAEARMADEMLARLLRACGV